MPLFITDCCPPVTLQYYPSPILEKIGRFPDLINCQEQNDRMQWLKLFNQDREITCGVNKMTVRDYVRERVGGQYLVKLYQLHNYFEQIDFDVLPNSFVIETNHDSGTVFLVQDKTQMDKQRLEIQIETALLNPLAGRGVSGHILISLRKF